MNSQLLHTPAGVRDIYGDEYAKKLAAEAIIRREFNLAGYRDIQTPTFEFFDIFANEIGTTPSNELYKLTDDNGNTMVLRPDFTPGVARCAAKYFSDPGERLRLCYLGNTYKNTTNLRGKLKERTEMGVELIGDAAILAEAETIALLIKALLAVGLKNFQVSIGQVEYFKGMCSAAALSAEIKLRLRDLIAGKNHFAVESLLKEAGLNDLDCEHFSAITDLMGGPDILERAMELAPNEPSQAAITNLIKLYDVLCEQGMENHVAFDLGMLSQYNYYTGIIFKCYAYGVGDAIAKGGRYDDLLEKFGKGTPAVGFGLVIDELMMALTRQGVGGFH